MVLVLTGLLAVCATSQAAVRTFALTGNPNILVSDATFELDPAWATSGIANDTWDGALDYASDIMETAAIDVIAPFGGIEAGPYALSRVDGDATSLYLTFNQHSWGVGNEILFVLPNALSGWSSGTDLPMSAAVPAVDVNTRVDGIHISYLPAAADVSIAAVPEPSAFALGGLVLAATGVGRWLSRRPTRRGSSSAPSSRNN
jgi:hypothetical protein